MHWVWFHGVGVWLDTYPTRWDTRLGSREREETRCSDLKILDEIYREKVFNSTEKHKIQKMLVHFEINLYFIKLNFYFNELYTVISNMWTRAALFRIIENHIFFNKLQITIMKKKCEQRVFCHRPYQGRTAFTSEAWWWPTPDSFT